MNRISKRTEQRLLGLVFILLSIGMFVVASMGTSLEDKDGGAILFFLPLGLWLLLTKRQVIH